MTEENKTEEVKPSWYIDENLPGIGDRPQWLNDKFKTVADMAKSYSELEKKFSSPIEDYNLGQSKYIDPDYEPFQDFLSLAKQNRVPKNVIDKMVDSYDKYLDEFNVDYEEEAKKLGDNAKDRLTTLENWAKANLSNDSFAALTSSLNTASGIKALEELRGKMMSNSTMIPAGNDNGHNNVQTIADIQAELLNPANLEKYEKDPKYRQDYNGRLELAHKANNNGYIDKMGA